MKKVLVLVLIIAAMLGFSLPVNAEIYQTLLIQDRAEWTNMFWKWNDNGDDVKTLNGTYWQGSFSVNPIDSGFVVTYGFSNEDGVVINSDPLTFYTSSSLQWHSGTVDFNGFRYGYEMDIRTGGVVGPRADTFVWTEGPVSVVPEPIGSILFITGGILLVGQRYMKKSITITCTLNEYQRY